jgi:adenine-specific DNA-methyltransferase
VIKYLGSKRLLVPEIVRLIRAVPGCESVADFFGGTSRVGHGLKREGFRVLASDHNAYAHALARCYVEADRESVEADATKILRELSALPGTPGYFTQTFCVDARYFQPKNGERIDAIRNEIVRLSLPPELESVLLVSLMEAADRVDSTTGVQMAYLKQWAARASRDLELRMPDVLPRARHGKGRAFLGDVLEAAREFEADVAYLDPPYNQHKYLGNYHVWETLVLWDAPEAYGLARKRVDCRERTSAFNSKRTFRESFTALVRSVRAPWLIVSFSDEGFLPREELELILASRGSVRVFAHDYKRYVGAQIGVYNPKGELVGTPGKARNREFLFVVAPDDAALAEFDAALPNR